MKRYLKCICLILSMVVLLTIPAKAVEANNSRASNYFASSAVYLYKTSNTTFQAWFDVTCVRTMDKVGAQTIKIQQSSDNQTWTTVASYSMDDYYSTFIKEDRVAHIGCISYAGTSGYYYRAYYKLYAEDETGTGIWTRYSSSIYID